MWAGCRINLRVFTRDDLPAMVRWNNDPELEYYVDCDRPKTLPACEAWFAENVPSRDYRLFALEDRAGNLIGELELDHISWRRGEAEFRIRIGEKHLWNQGLGTDAVRTFLRLAFDHFGLRRLYLKVYRFNLRAIRCYEKNGFRKIGILRGASRDDPEKWKDIILMSVDRIDCCRSEAAAAGETTSRAKRNSPSVCRKDIFP